MEFSAKMIAEYLHGEVVGDENAVVSSLAKIEEANPGQLTFLSNPKYTHYIYSTNASIVLVNKDFVPEQEIKATLVKVANSYECLAQLLNLYQQSKPQPSGIEQPSYIDSTVTIPEKVYIGAFAYIGKGTKIGNNFKAYPQVYVGKNVTIGENVTLYPGVKIYSDCVIGNNVTIHAGTVIGADGFGFAPQSDGNYAKIPQIGNVIIEDNVEIGANTTIDRATMGNTRISKGAKLDNLIQVGHNCVIGTNTVMAAQCGVAGSTKIGNNCMVGGQVGFAGHITIADGAKIGAQTGIDSAIKDSTTYLGSPAMPLKSFYKSHIIFKRLPELDKQVYELQKQIKELQDKLNTK
ncbi:MAG: UDP-3-O-(3-hydroxymyristoyl)glucosamine N-acyltransferase [Bacteroidales bacterium]|nr:UDP-3-O-(3-hydroxymyristoyl)glucosamine N-acyltransferase [Bacteroidales bacterium]